MANEVRESGIIYKSILARINMLYDKDPELAGKLAIACIEVVLTGEHRFSDDMIIELALEDIKEQAKRNGEKYDAKVGRKNAMAESEAAQLAGYIRDGKTQKEIGQLMGGISQSAVSKKINAAEAKFPYLFNGGSFDF